MGFPPLTKLFTVKVIAVTSTYFPLSKVLFLGSAVTREGSAADMKLMANSEPNCVSSNDEIIDFRVIRSGKSVGPTAVE